MNKHRQVLLPVIFTLAFGLLAAVPWQPQFAGVRPPQPHLNPLIASAGGPFPSATEAMHGTWRGSEEAGRVAAAAIAI
jgi:hypothetical protein